MTQGEPADHQAIGKKLTAWLARAAVAHELGRTDIAHAASEMVKAYESLLKSGKPEPKELAEATLLLKQLQSAENHRTMSAEHGLNDEAVDVTYEIQNLEQKLIVLVQEWQQKK